MGVWVCVFTFILDGSFKMMVFGCVCGCVVCRGFMFGLWCPSMRMGDVVGVLIGCGWMIDISERGGVRWSLVGVCLIGEREIDSCESGVYLMVCCGGVGDVVRLSEVVVGFLLGWGSTS